MYMNYEKHYTVALLKRLVLWNTSLDHTGGCYANAFPSKVMHVALSSLQWMVVWPLALKCNTSEHGESKHGGILLKVSLPGSTAYNGKE